MKIYPYQTPEGVIELVEKREYDEANEQLHKVRIRCSEWAEVAGKHGAEVDKLRAANAELIERLEEARESHLHASARDVQTIQRQSVELASADREIERLNLMVKMMDEAEELAKLQALAESRKIDFVSLAKALLETRDIQVFGGGCSTQDRDVWILAKMISDLLPAYESANLEPCKTCGGSKMTAGWYPTYQDPDNAGMHPEAEPCLDCQPVANPIDEAVRRMEAVTDGQIVQAYWSDGSWISNIRACLIQAAKGES